MLTKDDARNLLNFKYEGIRVETGVDFDDVYLFRAFMPIGGGEDTMNPFFTVNKETGEVSDFSPMANLEQIPRITALFEAEEQVPTKPATPQEALQQRGGE